MLVPRVLLLSFLVPLTFSTGFAGTYTEDFTTTTFKDTVNTTADWDTTAGEVRLFTLPTQLGTYNTPGNARDVAVSGDIAFVADVSSGLQVIDISDPSNPQLLGSYNTSGSALGVAVDGDLAFVADSGSGLVIVDISDPTNPLLLGTYNTPGFASDVEVAGHHAFVADYTGDLQVIRISNPALPTLAGTLTTPGNSDGIAVDGNHAFIADENFGLRVVDITDPTTPVSIGFIDTPGSALGVAVDGDFAFLADGTSGLLVFDITDPTNPTQIGSYNTPGFAYEVAVDGDFVLVADKLSGLQVIDVSDPTTPTLSQSFNTLSAARSVAVAGGHAFVAVEASGLQLIGISEPIKPLEVGSSTASGGSVDVDVAGNHAFLAHVDGLLVVDITDPASPTAVGSYTTPGDAGGVIVDGDHAYLANGLFGLEVIDISNPAIPTLVSNYNTPGDALQVDVAGDYAFVADGNFSLLHVIDVSDPSTPILVATYNTPGFAQDVVVAGDHAFVALLTAGIVILDISDPTIPTLVGSYSSPSSFSREINVAGNYAFVADGNNGLEIIDISNPTNPILASNYNAVTLGHAEGVHVIGDYAFVVDAGLEIIDISDPTNPILASSAANVFATAGIVVAGDYAFHTTETSDLVVWRVFQNEVFALSNVAQSLVVGGGTDPVLRSRLVTTPAAGVGWEVSSDNGANFQVVAPNLWTTINNPGTDILWRSTHTWAPGLNPTTASDLSIEWLIAAGTITSIADVTGDQGGRVDVGFERSSDDFDLGLPEPVTGYNLYRRVDAQALAGLEFAPVSKATAGPLPTPDGQEAWPLPGESVVTTGSGIYVRGASSAQAAGTFPPGTWKVVGAVSATQSDGYLIEATTHADSSATGTSYSVYLVTTHTTNPAAWFVSAPDSGYSVDNIAPGVPQGFAATFGAGTVDLSWDAAPEEDFQYFKVYRSTDPGFVPGPGTLVHETASTAWQDSPANPSLVYYKITTLDYAGNESDPASSGSVTAVGDTPVTPTVFALRVAVPNPSRAGTRIAFDLPVESPVSLKVFDVTGRLVRSLIHDSRPAGAHEVTWDGAGDNGRSVSAGIYLYRLRAGAFESTRRLVVIR